MWSSLFVFLIGLSNAHAWTPPVNCYEGSIKTRSFQVENIERQKYCTDTEGTELLSQNCVNNNKCRALNNPVIAKADLHLAPIGTPGFALCTRYKGEAQIIELTLPSGTWVKLDRCIFNDGSYIDTGSLLEKFAQ